MDKRDERRRPAVAAGPEHGAPVELAGAVRVVSDPAGLTPGDPIDRTPAGLAGGEAHADAPLPIAALSHDQRISLVRLIRSDNVGPVSFRALINHFGGATQALNAVPDLLQKAAGRRNVRICPRDRAEAELEAAAKAGMVSLFTIEPGYPAMLARIEVPPPLVYVQGRIELLSRTAIAIIGSRDSSAGGRTLARQFASAFAEAGLVVVSGLARGIDATAHEASLHAGTVAVVAGGIDIVYPPEHADLQRRIGEVGCLISEMPPGFSPRGQDFPRRNRIIAGLALAVVVIEAAKRSGTLITARYAGEMGREVCVVPGHPLDPRAEGTNELLRNGATFVTTPADVLDAIAAQRTFDPGALERTMALPTVAPASNHTTRPAHAPRRSADGGADVADRVLALLSPAPVSIDELARASGLSASLVRAALLDLMLAGRIEQHGSQLVSLRVTSDRV